MANVNCKHVSCGSCKLLKSTDHPSHICPFTSIREQKDEAASKMCKHYEYKPVEKWALFAVIHAPLNTYSRKTSLCIDYLSNDICINPKYTPVDEFTIRISTEEFTSEATAKLHVAPWMKNVVVRRVNNDQM